MIIDTIKNLSKYVTLNPLFADVIEFLKDHDLQTLEAGKYPIKDKDLFLNLQVAAQRPMEEGQMRLESGTPELVRYRNAARN